MVHIECFGRPVMGVQNVAPLLDSYFPALPACLINAAASPISVGSPRQAELTSTLSAPSRSLVGWLPSQPT